MQNQEGQDHEEENLFQILEEEKRLSERLAFNNDNHNSHLENIKPLDPKHLEEFDGHNHKLIDDFSEAEEEKKLADLVTDEVHQEVLANHQKILNEPNYHRLDREEEDRVGHARPRDQDMEIEEEGRFGRESSESLQNDYEERQEQDRINRELEERLLEPRLHELLLNINNLRVIIDSLVASNEESGNPNPNIQNLSSFNTRINQALSNFQANMSSRDGLQEQLRDINMLLGMPQNAGPGNINPGAEADQQQRDSWREKVKTHVGRILLRVQNYTKSFQFKLDMVFLISAMIIVVNLHLIPESKKKNGIDFINWLANSRYSKTLVWSMYTFLMLLIWYCFRILWLVAIGRLERSQRREIEKTMIKFNPFAHLSLILLTDSKHVPNKLDFLFWSIIYFFYSIIKVYNTLAFQSAQKCLDMMTMNSNEQAPHLNKLKAYVLLIFSLNLMFSAIGIWAFWYSGLYVLSILFHQFILNSIDSIKILSSIQIVQTNHLYYSNPNTPTIEDPKFKIELFCDTIYHFVRSFHFLQLLISYFQTSNLFVLNLWVAAIVRELNVSYSSLNKNYTNYQRFKELSAKLEEMFPMADPQELAHCENCAICHEPLRVARKLSCSHKFHIKCIYNWLRNSKDTCPICRKVVGNFRNPPQMIQGIFNINITVPTFVRRFISYLFDENIRNEDIGQGVGMANLNNPENMGAEQAGQQDLQNEGQQGQLGGINLENQNFNDNLFDNQGDSHELWRNQQQQQLHDENLDYWAAHAEAEMHGENQERNPRYSFDHSSSYIL